MSVLARGLRPRTPSPSGSLALARPAARPLLAGVRAYQRVTAGRASPCRFVPSCSTYAAEALETHGALTGSWLAVRRLCRCHPWGGQGWDPVPPRKSVR